MNSAGGTSAPAQHRGGLRLDRMSCARSAPVVQLDLFGAVAAAEQRDREIDLQRRINGLTCLRDAVPEALQLVTELRYTRREDSRSPRVAGGWAWCVSKAGLRVEPTAEWWTGARERGEPWGWDRTPAQLLTWDELSGLLGADPRRAEITAWAQSLPDPRWRLLRRPFELDPEPDGWHLQYFCRDHLHPRWSGRRHAWQLVLDLLTDAITDLTALSDDEEKP